MNNDINAYNATRHNERLDYIRCIMNYMIVLLHAKAAFQYVPNTGFEFFGWAFICSHLCWLPMPAFFMISGFLLFRNYSISTWPHKIMSRTKRLAVPYIAWNGLFVVFYIVMARFVPRLSDRVSAFGLDTIEGIISKIVSPTVAPIDGPLWYLRAIFFMSLASPLLFILLKPLKGGIGVCVCMVWVIIEAKLGLASYLHLRLPAYSLACVAIGGALALSDKDVVAVFRNRIWIVIGLSACILRAVISLAHIRFAGNVGLCASVVMPLLPVVEAPALLSLAANISTRTGECANFFRQMSFFAYAGHFLFCSMWLHLLAPFFSCMTSGKATLLIIIFIVCGLTTMSLFYKMLLKVMPRTVRLFDGTL